jgi:hypothetical protein
VAFDIGVPTHVSFGCAHSHVARHSAHLTGGPAVPAAAQFYRWASGTWGTHTWCYWVENTFDLWVHTATLLVNQRTSRGCLPAAAHMYSWACGT